MSRIFCRRIVHGVFASRSTSSRLQTELIKESNAGFQAQFVRYCSSSGNSSDNNSAPPRFPEKAVVDRYIIPVTVMATGAFLSPGVIAMFTRPLYLWFYRQYYDLQFDVNEFLVGARRALYFVSGKAFRKDFFGLKEVLTPEAMTDLREAVNDDSFRCYLNLRAPSTPVLYQRIGAAGFIDESSNSGQDDNVELYGRIVDSPAIAERRFEILVFFVCKIERLLGADATRADTKNEADGELVNRTESGVRNYARLLVMMTFSRLLERRQHQSSDWLVSSLALVPLQYTFTDK